MLDIFFISIKVSCQESCIVIIAIDPAITSRHETGIIVAQSIQDKFIIEDDASGMFPVDKWVQIVSKLASEYNANTIVAESNQGGDMVESLLRSNNINIKIVKVYASKSKYLRTIPIVDLYKQRRVIHRREFPELEKQMLSPILHYDRVDALVWAITFLQNTYNPKIWF
jgi:phage terminase large subunit-like protein